MAHDFASVRHSAMRLADRVARFACVSSVAEKSGWQEPEESQRVQGVLSLCGETCFAPAKEDFEDIPSLTLRAIENRVGQTSQMSGWRSHKNRSFDDLVHLMEAESYAFNPVPAAHRRRATSVPPVDLYDSRRMRLRGTAGREPALPLKNSSTSSPR